MPKAKAPKRLTTSATSRKAASRKSAKGSSRRKPAPRNRRRKSSNGISLEKFSTDLARAAGKIHDRLMIVGPGIIFPHARPPEYYVAQLVKLRVVSETEADELRELMAEVQKNSATSNGRVEELATAIVKNGKRGPLARTIAGIAIASAKKAGKTKLFSVAGDDFWGAVIGGVAGGIAGGMIAESEAGAVTGAVAGGIIFGGAASAHAAVWI